MGSYALAERLSVSAPICVVVAGLLIGNRGRAFGMSKRTQEHLGDFWELIDNILNVVLFMLLGLEVLVVPFRSAFLLAGIIAVGVSLLARWVCVAGIIGGLRKIGRRFQSGTILVLTWGGLRGGISLAMALSLPKGNHREVLIVATYCVVVFSVLVQGLTIAPLVRRSAPASAA
jgi:CPA1 family monovalent cation:H+ antiporter